MRERLIELLTKTFDEQYKKRMLITPQHTADHLLANGVVVPPCKVGDIVYVSMYDHVWEFEVANVILQPYKDIEMAFVCYGGLSFDIRNFGKTVFLTREEAERALRATDNNVGDKGVIGFALGGCEG